MAVAEERDFKEWVDVADRIFIGLIKKGEPFNSDTFYEVARAEFMPAQILRKVCGNLFKSYQQAGYIRKTGTATTSSRNQGNLLSDWIAVGAEAKTSKRAKA